MPFIFLLVVLSRLGRTSIFLILLLFGGIGSSLASAVELPFLTYGPSFSIQLNSQSVQLKQQIREALIEQRQFNSDLTIYDTPIKFAKAEKSILEKVLRALGYYQISVGFSIVNDQIRYRVSTGPQYLVSKVGFSIPQGVHWRTESMGIGIAVGDPVNAQLVLDALERFKKRLTRENCLLDVDASYNVFLDNVQHVAELLFSVQPSPQVRVNDLRLSGLTTVNEGYLRSKVIIQQGDCFSRNELDKARLALLQSNLVSSVDQTISSPVNGRVDIEFIITERNHRTVKMGVGYNADEKAIVSIGWEHRNLMGAGQKFNIGSHVSKVLQSIDASLTLPEFHRSDQTLELYGDLSHQKRNAFQAKTIIAGTVLTRQLSKVLAVSGGARLKLSSVLDLTKRDEHTLLSFPVSITWNTASDLLDPRSGWVLTGQLIPYTDLLNVGTRFVKTIGSGSTYYTSDWFWGRPTFALRGSVGSLYGASLGQVPADERYYVGGGGSVRGYLYQSLSNFQNNNPIGGRSFIETSFETRFHHFEKWGSVLFVDGGYAEPSQTPSRFNALHWSTGIGLRYYTAAMPLRFDVAWPLQRRKGIDDAFQIYISIGQAF